MTMWTGNTLAYVDDADDRERASNRVSRYLSYLDQQSWRQWPDDDSPMQSVRFACQAWHTAIGPVMSPGYVRLRPDLISITAHRDDEYGHLLVDVTVPLKHHRLRGSAALHYQWQDWQTDRPFLGDDGEGQYRPHWEPAGKRPAVFADAVVRLVGADWPLITPTSTTPAELLDDARHTVKLIASRINEEAGPLVAQLLA